MLIADLEEEVGRIDEWCYSGRRNSLEACCCVDEGLLSAYLESVIEFPSIGLKCRGLDLLCFKCYPSSDSTLSMSLQFPCSF
jgi:hypothetical protein